MNKQNRLTEAQLNALPSEVRDSILATYAEQDAKGKAPEPTAKVSKGGGISVYGLGRFPVTLSKDQWTRLFAIKEKIAVLQALPDAEFQRLAAVAKAKSEANPFKPS